MKQQLYTVYNQRCAGYLMMNGFPLLRLMVDNNTGLNTFIFANTTELHEWIEKWQTERIQDRQE